MPAFQRLKGFRDFLPEEMQARRDVFDRIEAVAQRYGFHEVDLPALEPLDLFLVKSGEELVDQTYSFTDKGDRDVTLVPEQTPSRARILANNKALTKPVKWVSTSKRWRYESPQKGRLREFYQTDFDIFGTDSVQADAEILALTVDLMDALEVLDTVDVLVNDRRLLEGILTAHDVDNTEAVMQIIDDKEKLDTNEFLAALQKEGLTKEQAENVDDLTDIAGPLTDTFDTIEDLAPEGADAANAISRLEELRDALDAYDIAEQVTFDLSIVRGLAYYTGLVFEVFDTKGDLRAVCGGGRYDELVQLFGGEEVSAVGFAIGDAVIEELMKREDVWPEEELSTDVYVLPVSDDVRNEALTLVRELRAEELIVETDLSGRNVGNQFSYAEKINATHVIVVGKRDLENDQVTVKDMASGDEERVPRDDVVSYLQQ